jgi:aldehyde:ferredoxin oxidoreductase
MMDVGARITNLARRYNLRNGRKASDDILPDRFFNEESLSGFKRGEKMSKDFFRSLIQKYYIQRGWNRDGEPTKEILSRYGLL